MEDDKYLGTGKLCFEVPEPKDTQEIYDEVEQLMELLRWSYSKLHAFSYSKLEDQLKLDEIKLLLENGV